LRKRFGIKGGSQEMPVIMAKFLTKGNSGEFGAESYREGNINSPKLLLLNTIIHLFPMVLESYTIFNGLAVLD